MEESNPTPSWDPPTSSPSTYEDLLNELLREPEAEPAAGATAVELVDGGSLGPVIDSYFAGIGGLGEALDSQSWWSAASIDLGLDQIEAHDLGDAFLVSGENASLPSLSSEVSSPTSYLDTVAEPEKAAFEVLDGGVSSPVSLSSEVISPTRNVDVSEEPKKAGLEILDEGASSPVSCNNSADHDCAPSTNSGEGGNVTCCLYSPVVTSSSDHGSASPDAGCDSSDAGALGGRSCDNFGEQSKRRSDRSPADPDEDAKRQSRLMRNRESAVQSRLRKKSYVNELEAKCRAMESQMSLLHQTVAFTSAQNAALRDELAHYRGLKGNRSRSGVTEPAALPSDSLPSESPSHLTTRFASELVAFLCHVFLLMLLQVLHLKPATSEGRPPNRARGERRRCRGERSCGGVEPLRTPLFCSKRRRKRRILGRDFTLRFVLNSSMISTPKSGHALMDKPSSTNCRICSKKTSKSTFRRSQYNSLA